MQKYLSLTGHVYTPSYVAVGAKKWATLPADVRKMLEDTAKDTQAWVYEKAAKDDEELLEKMKKAGIQVNNANKDAFIAASKPVYEEFAKEVPGREGSHRPRHRARQVGADCSTSCAGATSACWSGSSSP